MGTLLPYRRPATASLRRLHALSQLRDLGDYIAAVHDIARQPTEDARRAAAFERSMEPGGDVIVVEFGRRGC